MHAVGLNVAVDAVDVLEDEGQKREVELMRELGIHAVEARDVVAAVLRGQRDAGEGDLGAGVLELLDHGGEIFLGAIDGQAAEAVVAAEFENDDLRSLGEDVGNALEAIFRGVAADACVDDAVAIAGGVEETLEIGGVAGGGFDAESGGEAVAEAGDDGAGVGDVERGLSACGRGSRGVLRGGVDGGGAGREREESGEGKN